MTKTKLRSAYVPHARVSFTGELFNHRTGEFFKPPSRVKQSHVAECDINNILKQYSATGQLKHINAKAQMGAYRDLPDDLDFQTSLNIVRAGEVAFASLPAKTRDRFGNDPAEFLLFMADPANQDEAIKLGLATRRPDATPTPDNGGAGGKTPPAVTAPPAAPPEPEGSKKAPEGKN